VIEKFWQQEIEAGELTATPALVKWRENAAKVRRALSVDEDDLAAPFQITINEVRSNGTPVGNANLQLIDRITIVVNGAKILARAPFGTYDATWTTTDEPSSIVLEYTKMNQKIDGLSAPPGLWSWFQLLDMGDKEGEGNPLELTWMFEDAAIEVDAAVRMRGDECYFAKGSSFRRVQLKKLDPPVE
jgi:hypothetical protein